MKKIIYIVITLLLTISVSAEYVYRRSVAIENYSFEDGVNGWRSWYQYPSAEAVNRVTDVVVQDGDYSYAVVPVSTSWQDIRGIVSGDTVYVSGYIYLDPETTYEGMPCIEILSQPSNMSVTRAVCPEEAFGGEWILVEGNGDIPSGSSYIEIVLENHTNANVYFDNITLSVGLDGVGYATPITWRPGDYIPPSEEQQPDATPQPQITPSLTMRTLESTSSSAFDDMAGHWASVEVEYLASCGVITGVGDNKFEPNREITNNEFDLLLQRISDKIPEEFDDPDEIITRQEAVVLLVELLRNAKNLPLSAKPLVENFYDCDNINKASEKHISTAVELGIISGRPGNMFDPKASLTRAEASVLIVRIM